MDQGTNQTRVGYKSTRDRVRFDQHLVTKCPELGTKRLGNEMSVIRFLSYLKLVPRPYVRMSSIALRLPAYATE